jgi:small-conductance mechanosensitive channel/CRP-like cAMP-binding protein
MDAVPFWSSLAEQLWESRTPIIVSAYILTGLLVRGMPRVDRYHMRAAATLIVCHVVALGIATAQDSFGYDSTIARVASFAFASLSVLSVGVTALFRALLPRVGFMMPRILLDLLTAFGVIVVFIAVGRRAGFSVAGLITTSAVLTAVIGFSLQDTLGNVMGGLSVQLDKSISVGDWVSLAPGQPSHRVTEIRWRYTSLETRNGDTLIIPNGTLVKSQMIIIGRNSLGGPPCTRRQIEFFVDFRWSPDEVINTVETAMRKDPVARMNQHPAPQVLFMGVRDSYAQYVVRYWLNDLAVDDPTDSIVRTRVWFALRRAGIAMSIPASTIFLTHETPERETRKQEEELDQRMRALKRVDLFSGLQPKVQRALADQLEFTPFATGEAVTREGDTDDGLFMIVEGEAIVRIGAGREERDVARLIAGQFFGEMSLMTGEARTATVIAATELLCYRMNKTSFEEVLKETPAMADQIAEVLVMRRTALSAARDEREEVRRKRVETAKQDLLGRIRGFFGLDASR